MRLVLVGVSALLCGSVVAAELPISGVFGDELGCARHSPSDATGPSAYGGITVTAEGLSGLEWGCSWGDAWAYPRSNGTLFGVQGLCGSEGIPFLEQFIVELGRNDPTLMTVFAANGDPRWDLQLCEGGAGGKR